MNLRLKIILLFVASGLGLAASAAPPALIPAPQKIEWTGGELDCARYQVIAPAEAGFAVAELERALTGAIKKSDGTKIALVLGPVAVTNDEAYTLVAAPDGIGITAPRPVGLLYGVETLRQLLAGPAAV